MSSEPRSLYQYFQTVLDGLRSLLKNSPYFNGDLRELQLQWRNDLPDRGANKHHGKFKVDPRCYPPHIEIEEEVTWTPRPGILLERGFFRYEWGYKDGEQAESFPRHAFNSAHSNHSNLGHHYHAGGPGQPLNKIGINHPETDPNLPEFYFDWLKKHVEP